MSSQRPFNGSTGMCPDEVLKGGAKEARNDDLAIWLTKFYHYVVFQVKIRGTPLMTMQRTRAALDAIETRVSELIDRVDVLQRENRSLLARQESLVAERAGLVKRNEEARTRVEAMIERLKSLESAG